MTWRERVGIEPTSRLATTSAILKTVRTTRSVRSHDFETSYFIGTLRKYRQVAALREPFCDLSPSTPFNPALRGGLDRLIDLSCALCLHGFQDARIEVEGNRNAGMPKSFTDDLRVNPGPESTRVLRRIVNRGQPE